MLRKALSIGFTLLNPCVMMLENGIAVQVFCSRLVCCASERERERERESTEGSSTVIQRYTAELALQQ